MSNSAGTDHESRKTQVSYGIGDLGNTVINSAIQFFLMKFYTDAALVAPALAGNAILVGRIWDAVKDPYFGWITDRLRLRVGKRRIFMIFFAISMAISFALLWFVPPVNRFWTFVWIALIFIVFDTLWTLTNVSHDPLHSELTGDYDERTSLTAYRMVMAVPAYLIGAALTPAIVGLFALQRTGFGLIGIVYGILAAVVLLVSISGTRGRTRLAGSRPEALPFKLLVGALKNKSFIWLGGTYFIVNMSFAFTKVLMAYYVQYQLQMRAEISLVIGLMLICVPASFPLWQRLARKMDKARAYAIGIAVGGLALFVAFFLPHASTPLIYIVSVLLGLSFAAHWIFPWSMLADVVDFDRLETGHQRGDMYYGVWGLATKGSEALALVMVGWILSGFGYLPNVEQAPIALFGIRLFFGLLPSLIIFLSLYLLLKYPITRQGHTEVLLKKEAMDKVAVEITDERIQNL